jgi:cytosine/uracil/thiamine/allantoin permease
VMVPWKILHSAGSLLSFMNSLGVFLAPIMVSPDQPVHWRFPG